MDCSPVFFDESHIEEQAFSMLDELGLKRNPNLLSLSEEGAKRLGLNIENSQERLTEDTLIGHIQLSSLHSEQTRVDFKHFAYSVCSW